MTTSYTELSTLAACEQRWYFKYVERLPDPSGKKARLGSLIHDATGRFWLGEPWSTALDDADPDDDVLFDDASWLMERYEKHYHRSRDKVIVEATELDLSATLPSGKTLRGRVDQLWRVGDRLWLRECKTMGDWGPLDALTVDPQVTLYYWLVQQQYPELWGVMFDAIRTYRWKRDARPTAESFQMIQLDRMPAQIEVALEIADASLELMDALRTGTPIPNLGRDCSWCSYKLECWDRLAFPEPELEIVD